MDKKMIIKLLAGALFLSPVFSNATESGYSEMSPYIMGYDEGKGIGRLNIFSPKNLKNPFRGGNVMLNAGAIESVPMFLGIKDQIVNQLKYTKESIGVVDVKNPQKVACVHLSDKVEKSKYLKMDDVIYTFTETPAGKLGGENVYALLPILNLKNKKTLESYVAWFGGSWRSDKGYYRCQQKEDGKFDWKDRSGGIFEVLGENSIKHSDIVFYKSMPEESNLVFFPEAALASVDTLNIATTSGVEVSYDLVVDRECASNWKIDGKILEKDSVGFNKKLYIPGITGIDGTIERKFAPKDKEELYEPLIVSTGEQSSKLTTTVYSQKGKELHIFKTIHVFLDSDDVKRAEECFSPRNKEAFLGYLAENFEGISSLKDSPNLIFDTFTKSSHFKRGFKKDPKKEEKKEEEPFSGEMGDPFKKDPKKEEKKEEKPFSGEMGDPFRKDPKKEEKKREEKPFSGESKKTESTAVRTRATVINPFADIPDSSLSGLQRKVIESRRRMRRQARFNRNPAVSQSASSNSSRWQSAANTDDEE